MGVELVTLLVAPSSPTVPMKRVQWEWGNVITFSVSIWIFLPFYIRGGPSTMPGFLKRRYNSWGSAESER